MPPTNVLPAQVPRRVALGAAALISVASLGGSYLVPGYPAGVLRIATGNRGGVYHLYGQGLAKVIRQRLPLLRPRVLITDASVVNLRMIAAGQAEVAFSLADAAAAAYLGKPPFRAALPVSALARLYENYLHLVVPADSPITSLTAVRGRPVAVGAPGSGTELLTGRLLGVAGLDIDRDVRAYRLDLDTSVAALSSGRVAALFFSGGIPVAAIAALARRLRIRLVDLSEWVAPLWGRYGDFYAERTIPASSYGTGQQTATVGVPNYLVVAASMDALLAFALTRALFDGREVLAAAHPAGRRLDRAGAIETFPLPLHPGAVRYYRQTKP